MKKRPYTRGPRKGRRRCRIEYIVEAELAFMDIYEEYFYGRISWV
jgi:hypothetical protein